MYVMKIFDYKHEIRRYRSQIRWYKKQILEIVLQNDYFSSKNMEHITFYKERIQAANELIDRFKIKIKLLRSRKC